MNEQEELGGLVLKAIVQAIGPAIEAAVGGGYGSGPIQVAVNRADEAMVKIRQEEMQEALTSKVARVLIDKAGGIVEQTVGKLTSDQAFRAKLILAINRLVKEHQ